MATGRFDGQKPPPRRDSFQQMLNLEKKYKLARLQSTQTPPPRNDSSMSVRVQIKQPPIQVRRNPKEVRVQPQLGQQDTPSLPRVNPLPPLSITIPPPRDLTRKGKEPQIDVDVRPMPAELDEQSHEPEEDDDKTPRETSAPILGHDGSDNDDDDDGEESEASESDQSSICQSPSWEGYGQSKKKKKKKEAEQQRKKEKKLAEHELKAASKKKHSNRLSKAPPQENTKHNVTGERSSSSASGHLDSSKAGSKLSASVPVLHETLVPEVRGMHTGAAVGAPRHHHLASSQTAPVLSSQAPAAAPRAVQAPPEKTRHGHAHGSRGKENEGASSAHERGRRTEPKAPLTVLASEASNTASSSPTTPGSDKMSYPPTSSRSHALRNALPTIHTRRNSTSAPASPKVEDKPRFFRSRNKNSSSSREPSLDSSTPPISSGHRGRQTISGTISSYVRKARAQSIERSIAGFMEEAALPNPTNQPALFEQNQPVQKRSMSSQRPSSSQSRMSFLARSKTDLPGKTHGESDGTETTTQKMPRRSPTSASPPRIRSVDKDDDANDSPTSLDSTTPAGGILSSIRSRMGKRSSSSGRSTPSGVRSLGGKSVDALSQPASSATSLATYPPTDKQPQSTPQISLESPSGTRSTTSIPTSDGQKGLAHLPKACRILGEVNSDTLASHPKRMSSRPSEGSSASSFHEDSSTPASPASTPDTSRPQSTKGSSPRMTASSHEDVTTKHALGSEGSKERATTGIKRPSSSGRLLEAVKRPGSRGLVLEVLQDPEDNRPNKAGASESASNLTEGLGLLDDAWGTKAAGADADAQSFVTTLSNQEDRSGATVEVSKTRTSKSTGLLEAQTNPESRSREASGASSKQSFHDADEMPSMEADDTPRQNAHRSHEKRSTSAAKEEARQREEATHVHIHTPHGHETNGAHKSKSHSTSPTDADVQRPSSSGRSTPSAMYLQEARRTIPLVSSPLSNVIRSAKANMSASSSAAAPAPASALAHSAHLSRPAPKALLPAPPSSSVGTSSPHFRIPAQEPEQQMVKPMAKMLVECCHCKYFHDMPSRVYECMAQPDAMVTDRELGVSGAITTMVKCPWCSHNMSTKCCAGYAAVVYLKERLH